MRRKKKRRMLFICIGLCMAASLIMVAAAIIFIQATRPGHLEKEPEPDEVLLQYMRLINENRYTDMYALLAEQSRAHISEEDFITKNKNIYEGIEVSEITIQISDITEVEDQTIVSYDCRMDTLAGEIAFSNQAYFIVDPPADQNSLHQSKAAEPAKRLLWSTQLIFPELGEEDRVKINLLKSERGDILDRYGVMLAGKGVAASIGFVPGKMSKDRELGIKRAAELLDIPAESIRQKLDASYVKDDMFIPVKTIAKGQDELEELLLEIKGIKISDSPIRYYPFGERTSHLTGYIQNVSAEDLEKLDGQGYHANSVIGRTGLEMIYEERLRGIDGYEIVIVDRDGGVKRSLAKKDQRDGETIRLTIDAWLQSALYDLFYQDKSASVVMNPKTGEILALVSTPAFDANDFVLGLSAAKWEAWNTDENKPLYNRFKAALCPGSGFKPIIGAIGLTTRQMSADENYGYSGRSWQKDGGWGGYYVTTLKDYGDQVNLRNALIYSDNIYFAKAALNIGKDTLAEQLLRLGFDEEIPFEIGLYWSSFSNTNSFESEIQLADSGYGQAQVLINPIHMACLYSAFVNEGNMIKPVLLQQGQEPYVPTYWKEHVFTKEAAGQIRDDLIQVVEQGAGGLAKIEGRSLAGKTGTAEIKQSKADTEGTELGWFNIFTAEEDTENPLLVITMVEDVKNRGGSGYVIPKIKMIFEYW